MRASACNKKHLKHFRVLINNHTAVAGVAVIVIGVAVIVAVGLHACCENWFTNIVQCCSSPVILETQCVPVEEDI